MGGYELHDQLSEQFFRPAGGYFANFSSSVGSTSEEIYSQQAVYFSYTSCLQLTDLVYARLIYPGVYLSSTRRTGGGT